MQISDQAGSSGSLYASVPVDPRRACGGELGGSNLVEQLRATAQAARVAGDEVGAARCFAALSDHHLEQGRLAAAKQVLLHAMVHAYASEDAHLTLATDRRELWLDHLAGEDVTGRLSLLLQRARTLGDRFEESVCAVYLAHAETRQGRSDRVHSLVGGAVDHLRRHADGNSMARMALLGAVAYQQAGQTDHALVEALRVQFWAEENDDEALLRASGAVLKTLRTAAPDDRVHRLIAVAIEVGRQRDLDQILQTVVHSVLDLVDADRAFVVQSIPGQGYSIMARISRAGHPGDPSRSVVERVLREGREVVTTDLGHSEGLSAAMSIVSLGLQTALCVPMMDGPRVIGAIYADSTSTSHAELDATAWLVRAFAAHVVTAIRTAEHLRETERRRQMDREVNHDVRNLVGSLRLGLSELSEEATMEPWARELVGQLEGITQLVQRQVSQALNATRPEPNRLDLGDLVHRACSFTRFDCDQRGVRLQVDVEHFEVFAREDDLTRVVSNLLVNALKYSPETGRIHVALTRVDGWARLWVRDEGSGIPPESLEAILASGVQASGHRAGHGLGLGICRKLVTEAGGRIRAFNDDGAVFEVLLPALDRGSAL